MTYSAYCSTLFWVINYLLLCLVSVDHVSDCTVLTLIWLEKRELTSIFSELSFWRTKFLSKRNFVHSIKSASLTGFYEAEHNSLIALLSNWVRWEAQSANSFNFVKFDYREKLSENIKKSETEIICPNR